MNGRVNRNEKILLGSWILFLGVLFLLISTFSCDSNPYGYIQYETITEHDTVYVYDRTLYTNGFEVAGGTQWVLGEEYELWCFLKVHNISGWDIDSIMGHGRLYYDSEYEHIAYEKASYFSSEPVYDIQADTLYSILADSIGYTTLKYMNIPVQSYYWTVWIE